MKHAEVQSGSHLCKNICLGIGVGQVEALEIEAECMYDIPAAIKQSMGMQLLQLLSSSP
jgi:hypothetical protein